MSWLCPYSLFHPLQMVTPGPAPEGYAVLYRCLLPVGTAWSQQDVGRELSTVIPALQRGYQYEFKVRPYAKGAWGLDSNSWHLWIPEEGTLGWWVGWGGQWRSQGLSIAVPAVPSAAPQHVTVGQVEPGNSTVVVRWEPPPPDAHNGIIRGYQVWVTGGTGGCWPMRIHLRGPSKRVSLRGVEGL